MRKKKFVTVNDDVALLLFVLGILLFVGATLWKFGPSTAALVLGTICLYGAVQWRSEN